MLNSDSCAANAHNGKCLYVVQITRTTVLLEEIKKRLDRGDVQFNEVSVKLEEIGKSLEKRQLFEHKILFGYKFFVSLMGIIGFCVMAFLTWIGARN